MSTSLPLQLFHSLPPHLRQLAVAWKGRQLQHWRYGPETEELAQAALEREAWSEHQWRQWQGDKLEHLLRHAVQTVPFYRHLMMSRNSETRATEAACRLEDEDARFRGFPSNGSFQRQEDCPSSKSPNWPILSKQELRTNPHLFLSASARKSHLRIEQTSGTTGTPLKLWQTRDTCRRWYALMEARWRGWYGLSRRDCWAILGGQLVTPMKQKEPPFWIRNSSLNQLYLSSYHLRSETCASYLKAIDQWQALYLWGYASSLHSLALFAEEQHLTPPRLKMIISNAEPLYTHQRELIGRVFGCPVRDTYGMSEMVCAASECESGTMHLWPEVGIYEVLRDDSDEPVEPGQPGRLVCTGLLNTDMPLIRYEVGDRVAIAPPEQKCSCGRTLPILLSVEGRSDDVILTPDGRRIGRLDPVFKSDLPINEAQIIQESLGFVRILIVPAQGFAHKHERLLVAALKDRIGNLDVKIERVKTIPRTANGKFRAVISKVANGRVEPTSNAATRSSFVGSPRE